MINRKKETVEQIRQFMKEFHCVECTDYENSEALNKKYDLLSEYLRESLYIGINRSYFEAYESEIQAITAERDRYKTAWVQIKEKLKEIYAQKGMNTDDVIMDFQTNITHSHFFKSYEEKGTTIKEYLELIEEAYKDTSCY
jgi:hypothetical protein